MMTKPDEALLYAREHWATIYDANGARPAAEGYRRGDRDDELLARDALFYRAGAAASAARIKALEARVAELERKIAPTPRAAPGSVSDIGTVRVTDGLGNIQFVPRARLGNHLNWFHQ